MTTSNDEYVFKVWRQKPPKFQGFFLSIEEVEAWAASSTILDDVLSFLQGGGESSEDQASGIFVYTHEHAGSGMDNPTAKAVLQKDSGVLEITFLDQCKSGMRTMDLCFQPMVVALRFSLSTVQSIHVNGIQVNEHTFLPSGVLNKEQALAILHGIDSFRDNPNDELRGLTSISINIGDKSLLQALAYLLCLQELQTKGIRWTPETLKLLGNLTSLQKVRVGGSHWQETNNFKYSDLDYLSGLTNLALLDLSYLAIDGAESCGWWFARDDKQPSQAELSRQFARGMKHILNFTNLPELILGAQMYPKGAKVLTSHPNLKAILSMQNMSYEVVQILAKSRLATQLTTFNFQGTYPNQLTAPIMREIAKFVNLTHLGMQNAERLDDLVMEELTPLGKVQELYVAHLRITSEGLYKFFIRCCTFPC